MKNRKLSIFLALALVLSMLAMTACGSSGNQQATTAAPQSTSGEDKSQEIKDRTFTIGYSSAEGMSADLIIKEKTAELTQKTDGKLKFQIYPAAQLGGDREMAESVQLGDQDILMSAPSPLISFVPELAVLDMPMAFAGYTYDEIDKVTSGEVGDFYEKISAAYERAGFKLLSLSSQRMYRIMTSNKAVNTAEDFSGIRIRTMENKYHMNFWSSLGASPTPVNFAELYLALQQGLVDAQENPVVVLVLNGFAEQQKYAIETDHILFFVNIIMNLDTYNSLTDKEKELLDDMIADASGEMGIASYNDDIHFREKAVEQGIEFIKLNDDVISFMQDKANETAAMISNDIGQELVDSLLNSLQKAAE
jgi:tripartite ATP-independent transporter DctP family solute receptor